MSFTTDDPRFIETLRNPVYFCKKRHQEPIHLDERLIEFFKDESVNNAFCVDETGKKVRLNGYIDLNRMYGLPDEVCKAKRRGKKIKVHAGALPGKDVKIFGVNENTLQTDSGVMNNERQKDEVEEMVTEATDKKQSPTIEVNRRKSVAETHKQKSPSTSKVIKKAKKSSRISKDALEIFKKELKEVRSKENEVKEEKIHKEFTWTISDPDEPRDDDEDDDDKHSERDDESGHEGKNFATKELSEAEKADIELLTMDTNSVMKQNNTNNNKTNKKDTTSKMTKAMIEKAVEREVTLEDFQEILTNSRFKSLREDAVLSIEQNRSNTVKKRLIAKRSNR